MKKTLIMIVALLLCTVTTVATADVSHNFINEYTGTETCLNCHQEQGEDFSTSIHYTWTDGETGKLQGVNDFCGTTKSNEALCGKCHAGFGLVEGDFSVEKIDCLICHAPDYKKTTTGPDPSVDTYTAARGVTTPTREMCLRCHANAGGGDNKKRGDIELAMGAENVSVDLDVHMAAGMLCQDCHVFTDHHVSGIGMDMRVADTDIEVSCDNCHGVEIHENEMINQHSDKIYCTTCHIRSYGKEHPAETVRNWQDSSLAKTESNPAPIQVWWNRDSWIMDLTDTVVVKDGVSVVSKPRGSIDDPDSKIYAARLHLGTQPWDGTNMLPFVVKTKKGGGTMTEAVYDATGITYSPLEYVNTERYMGIFHGVSPKEEAMTCTECHQDHLIDFESLGYDVETFDGVLTSVTTNGRYNLADFRAEDQPEVVETETFGEWLKRIFS